MIPEQNNNFFATLDNSSNFPFATFYTTVIQLAQAAQKKDTFVAYITSLLQQHAFTLQQVDDEQHVFCGTYVTNNTSKQTLLLFSACPPQQNAFARWGAFVTRLLTFTLYHKTIGNFPLNILWLIEVEEFPENGEKVAQVLAKNSNVFGIEGCLFDMPYDTDLPAPSVALGMKGMLSIEIGVETGSHDRQASYGAILPDAAWRLIWALNSLKDAREEIQIEGFYETLVPMEDEEIALLGSLLPDEQALKQYLNVDEFLLQLHGLQLYYAYLLLPTCTVTSIASGDTSASPQTLPSSATALVTMQLVPDQQAEDIYEKLRRHLDAQGFGDVYVKVLASRNPQHTPLQNGFARMVYENTVALYGENLLAFPLMPPSVVYNPLQLSPSIPVVYAHLYDRENQLYEHDTVVREDSEERQTLISGIKHLAMIVESMGQVRG